MEKSSGKMVIIDEMSDVKPDIWDNIIIDPINPDGDRLPRRLAIDPNSPDYHPCYCRVGLRIDGEERNDIAFYDMDRMSYMTTAKTSHLAKTMEPYWRFRPSRQHRRAEKRWELKHKKR